jgi:hypothetical protein
MIPDLVCLDAKKEGVSFAVACIRLPPMKIAGIRSNAFFGASFQFLTSINTTGKQRILNIRSQNGRRVLT